MYADHDRLRNTGSPDKAEERWSVDDEHSVASLHVVILDDRRGFLRYRNAARKTHIVLREPKHLNLQQLDHDPSIGRGRVS